MTENIEWTDDQIVEYVIAACVKQHEAGFRIITGSWIGSDCMCPGMAAICAMHPDFSGFLYYKALGDLFNKNEPWSIGFILGIDTGRASIVSNAELIASDEGRNISVRVRTRLLELCILELDSEVDDW